jgi:HEAT repeat protein
VSRAALFTAAALVLASEAAAQVAAVAPPAAIASSRDMAAARLRSGGWARAPRFRRAINSDRTPLDSARATAFLNALSQSSAVVCEMAVDNVGNGWGWSDGPSGVRSLRDQSSATRAERVAFGRAEVTDNAVPVLASGLSRQDPCSRRAAARLLGQSELVSASRALRDAARSSDGRVREAAFLGIGIREDSANYQSAVQGLGDRDPEVVRLAAWALGEYERPESVPLLVPLLKRGEASIRMAAANALGQIEDTRATPELVKLLSDRDESVRLSATWALAQLEDAAAVPGLAALLNDSSSEVRLAAVEALGAIEGGSVTAHLIVAMKDRDPEVRRAAAEALGNR